ncbi:15340_t:CDS:2 [Dentiscutata heterogama]|uniref:15340_t:CDS:1 n=1 Tax=Dentiscutata heterogama TaxID=1316150 RepID=A0ACA9KIB9_9GLOM|nr:15340_t:CDS:2 [Dentiscutata heterogama]
MWNLRNESEQLRETVREIEDERDAWTMREIRLIDALLEEERNSDKLGREKIQLEMRYNTVRNDMQEWVGIINNRRAIGQHRQRMRETYYVEDDEVGESSRS